MGSLIIVPSSALESMNLGAIGGLAALSETSGKEYPSYEMCLQRNGATFLLSAILQQQTGIIATGFENLTRLFLLTTRNMGNL